MSNGFYSQYVQTVIKKIVVPLITSDWCLMRKNKTFTQKYQKQQNSWVLRWNDLSSSFIYKEAPFVSVPARGTYADEPM